MSDLAELDRSTLLESKYTHVHDLWNLEQTLEWIQCKFSSNIVLFTENYEEKLLETYGFHSIN